VAKLLENKMFSLGPVGSVEHHRVGSRLTKMFLNHVHSTVPLFTFKQILFYWTTK